MTTVTTIIPAYNSEPYLAQAIDSALGQRGVDVEVIVLDDGSTDGTWRVMEGYGDVIRRVRLERVGPYRARNHGARLASGEWLALLDADDEWLPDKLARQLERAAADGSEMIYTDRLNFGDAAHVHERQSDGQFLSEGDIFEPILMGNVVSLSSVMIRKAAFERLGGFAEDRFGVLDWDLWLRYAAAGGRVGLCREPLTRYRWHAGAISNDYEQRHLDRVEVVRRALASPRGRQVSPDVARRALANAYKISASYIGPSRPGRAVGWYLQAIRHWPWEATPYKQIVKCCLGMA